jgi:hypothetical protein
MRTNSVRLASRAWSQSSDIGLHERREHHCPVRVEELVNRRTAASEFFSTFRRALQDISPRAAVEVSLTLRQPMGSRDVSRFGFK